MPVVLVWLIGAIPILILVRALYPFRIVRIGVVDVGRIGGVYQGDWYLSEKACGQHRGKYLDLFYFNKSTNQVNRQWEIMWKRALPHVTGVSYWRNVIRLNRMFPGFGDHEIPYAHVYPSVKTWQEHLKDPDKQQLKTLNDRLRAVLMNTKANISFNTDEKKQGQRALEDLGIPKDHEYICFHARDSSYLDVALKNVDWSYHNYRDSKIQNYIEAAEEMCDRGYYAIRMGAIVKDKINSSQPKIIDYATNGKRSDFNDIYLGSHCRFFLCSDSGINIVPEMFRIPTVYVNWTPILRISTWSLNGLFIFKKFYLKGQNRWMTFLEIMKLEFGHEDTKEVFAQLNLELIENTPEEIYHVTVEMDERLKGTWRATEEDDELQKRFWALFGSDKLKSPDLRIGAEYLRQNKWLLD